MANKLYRRYRMNFSGKWFTAFCALCGLAVFLRFVYYFMFADLAQCGTGEVVFNLVLPVVLLCGIIVIMKLVRLDAPGILAILGCVVCLLLTINGFDTQNILRLVFSLLGYTAGGALLLLTVAGFVPTRQFSVILFAILLILRVLLFRPVIVTALLTECSDLCMIASLAIMPATMRKVC